MEHRKHYKGNQFLVFYDMDGFVAFIAENVAEACIILNIEVTAKSFQNMTSRIGQAIKNNGSIIVKNDRYTVKSQKIER